VGRTGEHLQALMSCSLAELRLAALMLDAIDLKGPLLCRRAGRQQRWGEGGAGVLRRLDAEQDDHRRAAV